MRHARGPFVADAELADVMREVNELRRARSLRELDPDTTNFRVTPRSSHCRLRRRCRRRRSDA